MDSGGNVEFLEINPKLKKKLAWMCGRDKSVDLPETSCSVTNAECEVSGFLNDNIHN